MKQNSTHSKQDIRLLTSQFLQGYEPLLWKTAHKIREQLPAWISPEDIYQDLAESLLKKAMRYDPGKSAFSTWLTSTVYTAPTDFIRKYHRRVTRKLQFVPLTFEIQTRSFEDDLLETIRLKNTLKQAYQNFTDRQKIIVERLLAWQTPKQITESLSISMDVYHQNTHRIRKKLKGASA